MLDSHMTPPVPHILDGLSVHMTAGENVCLVSAVHRNTALEQTWNTAKYRKTIVV